MPIELFEIRDWQTWAALSIVGIAVSVLLRKAWQTFRGESAVGSGCGTSCDGCPSNSSRSEGLDVSPKVIELVQLDDSPRP